MVSPQKANSWARKLAKELRERVSQDFRREMAAKESVHTLDLDDK